MKNKFSEYYYLSEAQQKQIIESNSDDTLYVFDTNVFLSIYDASEKTAEITLKMLEVVANHSWMPYQVGMEFHRNRITKLDNRTSVIKKNISQLKTNTDEIRRIFKHEMLFDKQMDTEINTLVKNLFDKGNAILIEKLNEAQEWVEKEECLTRIEHIYNDDKIGNPLSKNQYEALVKDIDTQWAKQKGLGYKDKVKEKKDEHFEIYPGNFMFCNAYGDPVVIEEIRNEVARRNREQSTIKNVVFVSNDQKTDFITKLAKDQNVPQLYLQRYMCSATENYPTPLKHFIQVTLQEFIKHLNKNSINIPELELVDVVNELEELDDQKQFIEIFEPEDFKLKRIQLEQGVQKAVHEMKLDMAKQLLIKLGRVKEIHAMHNPLKDFKKTAYEYTQRNREDLHWEEIEEALDTYKHWLESFGYLNVEDVCNQHLLMAQQKYLRLISPEA